MLQQASVRAYPAKTLIYLSLSDGYPAKECFHRVVCIGFNQLNHTTCLAVHRFLSTQARFCTLWNAIRSTRDLFYYRLWHVLQHLSQANYNPQRFKIESVFALQEMVLKIIITCDIKRTFIFTCDIQLFECDEVITLTGISVIIASQSCYVSYFANYVLTPIPEVFALSKYKLKTNTIPNFDAGHESDTYFVVVNTKVEILCDYYHKELLLQQNNIKKVI